MKRAILATAGHVDHGKTALLKALTGIDCDRWKEEKERGITIDLGFAFMQKDDLQIGFVDVPGHEKFIKNMLAGAGGVDAFLLVVSAEEGIKPQTVEHVEILKILGVTSGLCALTKVDTMDEELSDLVEEEVNDFLQSQFPEPIPIIRTSARDGTGIQHLHDRLIQFVSELSTRSDTSHPSRLPLDRAFILKGIALW